MLPTSPSHRGYEVAIPGGIASYLQSLERRRRLKAMLDIVANTGYVDAVEKALAAIMERIQPYLERQKHAAES